MSIYQEFRFYSVFLDCEAVRLSMTDRNGGEFFMIVPAGDGKKYVEERSRALDAISFAIVSGREPGEVRVH